MNDTKQLQKKTIFFFCEIVKFLEGVTHCYLLLQQGKSTKQ